MKLLSACCGGFLMSMVIARVDGYTELGCAADFKSSRVMSEGPSGNSGTTMSAEVCSVICVGYEYFGTQFAYECWCSDSIADSVTFDHDGCDRECTGTSGEICGGKDALTVYQNTDGTVEPSATPEPTTAEPTTAEPVTPTPGGSDYTELGCVADSGNNRVLPEGPSGSKGQTMSAEICSATCAEYEYFGTQFAYECWCSDSIADSVTFDHDGCTKGCTGTSGEICGGRKSLTVYQRTDGATVEPSATPEPTTLEPTTAEPTTAEPTTPPPMTTGGDACDPNPCNNGGSCALDPGGGHICTCASGFGGMSCQTDTSDLTEFSITLSFTLEDGVGTVWTADDEADMRRFADRWENVITHVPCGDGNLEIEVEWAKKFAVIPPTTSPDCPQISSQGNLQNTRAIEDWKRPDNVWESFVTHEMGHAVGIGYLWGKCTDCIINGTPPLEAEWDRDACPSTYDTWIDLAGVPFGTPADIIETDTAGVTGECVHWDFDEVPGELNNKGSFHKRNPNGEVFLSKLSLAALEDIGYIVDPSKADPFSL